MGTENRTTLPAMIGEKGVQKGKSVWSPSGHTVDMEGPYGGSEGIKMSSSKRDERGKRAESIPTLKSNNERGRTKKNVYAQKKKASESRTSWAIGA